MELNQRQSSSQVPRSHLKRPPPPRRVRFQLCCNYHNPIHLNSLTTTNFPTLPPRIHTHNTFTSPLRSHCCLRTITTSIPVNPTSFIIEITISYRYAQPPPPPYNNTHINHRRLHSFQSFTTRHCYRRFCRVI